MRKDEVFDFLRADFFAASIDQVFLSSLDHIIPRGMLPHQVARSVETVRGESAGIIVRHAEVAPQGVWATAAKFSDLAKRNFLTFVIRDSHFVIRADRTANSFQTNVLGIFD